MEDNFLGSPAYNLLGDAFEFYKCSGSPFRAGTWARSGVPAAPACLRAILRAPG